MSRMMTFRFGLIAYFTFFAAVVHTIFFIENMVVSKTIDVGGLITPKSSAIAINLLLMAIFALQHSVMARQEFKRWWTKLVPTSVERHACVFIASVGLLVVMWQWRPMPELVWQVTSPPIAVGLTALSFLGWLIGLTDSFVINHWELFEFRHIGDYVHDSVIPEPAPRSHQFARHLTYLGFMAAVWSTPTMSTGHLLFAFMTLAYISVGAAAKNADFSGRLGGGYRRYRTQVAMLVPRGLMPWRQSI